MYDSILVPTDGSEGARAATRHAMNLATAFDSEVHLLSVVNPSIYSSDLADMDFPAGEHRKALEEHATEAVEALEALLDERDLTYRTAIEEGVPYEAIPAYAEDHAIDLLSMGTHGRTGFDRLLVGSVTERVVRTSSVPVLTSRFEPEKAGYDDILLPTDGSEAASAAIEHAIALAERYDATIHALSVVDLSALAGSYDGAAVPGVIEALEGGSEQTVSEVAERCERQDVDVRTEVTQGTPYRAIGAYVEDHDVDLVTMGTHGRTGLGRYLLGSVTERVVRTSSVPVLTVR